VHVEKVAIHFPEYRKTTTEISRKYFLSFLFLSKFPNMHTICFWLMEFGTELKILREKEKKRKSRLHQTIVTVRMASSTVCMHRVSFCCDGVHVAESVKLVLARNKLLGLLIRESPLGFGGGGGGKEPPF